MLRTETLAVNGNELQEDSKKIRFVLSRGTLVSILKDTSSYLSRDVLREEKQLCYLMALTTTRFYAYSVDGRRVVCVLRTGVDILTGEAQVGLLRGKLVSVSLCPQCASTHKRT
jgi:hypothetical protein